VAIKTLTSVFLGYPRDARLLILNIDDLGFCFSANTSAIETLEHGVASSTTVMLPPPWSKHACQLLRERPHFSHGIHLTAISEHQIYRWRPLTSPDKIRTLVDREGFFPLETEKSALVARAKVNELELEWRAQIESGLAQGLHPVQLDSHCNIHDARADIFEMTVRLAREYGLALRVHQREFIPSLKRRNLPVIDHTDLDSFDLPTRGKSRRYALMLHELPTGVSEWAIHCARGTAELRAINPRWRVRAADYRFFNSPECRRIIRAEGIEVISYAEFQPYWKK
jgi:predicted glycoside hydrolase/deacetylase ChbG (UPF0249 family)